MNKTYATLPNYLKRYVVEQDYESYTPQQHATWRYIMRRSQVFFAKHAVPAYTQGIAKTGIPIHRIPRISEIDRCLKEFGWGAIGVCGFIPPAAFLEFQTLGIMPIAMDMRTLEHTAYTPAPDIVHEAAGHVPILVDPQYRRYLQRYAHMASKVIITKEDVALYEAIRILSDIKENPDTTPQQLKAAEDGLTAASDAMTHTSELSHVSRLAWWTAEYGLVGSLESPKIYGAGLLSSVGESQHCLGPKVKKIPLSIACVHQTYDITEPQPQLFVAESMEHLTAVLEDLEGTLAFKVGGVEGLKKALQAKSINTVVLDSGVGISGELVEFLASPQGDLEFLKFSGPVQLSQSEKQLPGHGRERHGSGFSSPLGRWKKIPNRLPQDLSDSDLADLGLRRGVRSELEFTSGFKVAGTLWHVSRSEGKINFLTWNDVTVTRGAKTYYEPSWGSFDMVVGLTATSVHGGPADRETYGEYDLGNVSTTPGRKSPYTQAELHSFDVYTRLRNLREGSHTGEALEAALKPLASEAKSPTADWLVGIEILELAHQRLGSKKTSPWVQDLETSVRAYGEKAGGVTQDLILHGAELVAVGDGSSSGTILTGK